MIDMSMREDEKLDRRRIEREALVVELLRGLVSLKQAAIHHEGGFICRDMRTRSGYCTGRTAELKSRHLRRNLGGERENVYPLMHADRGLSELF